MGHLWLRAESICALTDNCCLVWDLPLSRSSLLFKVSAWKPAYTPDHPTSSHASNPFFSPHTHQVDLYTRILDLIPCCLSWSESLILLLESLLGVIRNGQVAKPCGPVSTPLTWCSLLSLCPLTSPPWHLKMHQVVCRIWALELWVPSSFVSFKVLFLWTSLVLFFSFSASFSWLMPSLDFEKDLHVGGPVISLSGPHV